MPPKATLKLDNKDYDLPVITGTEGEKAVDFRSLRNDSGYVSFDEGYGNTGSCLSSITFIDGEAGILRYRGYPIEQLAEYSSFIETAYLIINGELPTPVQRKRFSQLLTENSPIHSGMEHLFEGFPADAHPMAILSAMLNSLGSYYPHLATNDHQHDLENFE